MTKLILDTSRDLLVVGAEHLGRRATYTATGLKHNSILMTAIDSVLGELQITPRDLDTIFVVTGPGSFTGLRLGVTAANALSYALGIDVYEVFATDIIAVGHNFPAFVVAIDARNSQYYYAEYRGGVAQRCALGDCNAHFLGQYNGSIVYANSLEDTQYVENLFRITETDCCKKTASAQPLYVKKSQAEREKAAKDGVVLVEMTAADIQAVNAIDAESFPPYLLLTEQQIAGELNSPRANCYVLKKKGETVGFFILLTVLDEGHILDIAVSASHRGNGYGKQLLDGLCELAKRMNLSTVTLEVNEHNSTAISLYEKKGFVRVGYRAKYYNGEDGAVLMTLEL